MPQATIHQIERPQVPQVPQVPRCPRCRPLATGIAIAGIALLMLSRLSVSSSYAADVLPALVLFGAGVGLTVTCAVNAASSVVEQADAGAASAMVNTSQMIGASVGTAILDSLPSRASPATWRHTSAEPMQPNPPRPTATTWSSRSPR
jgi:hypothetical protein